MENFTITREERNHLRELAKKQLEYSMLPIMRERKERWYKHNDLKGDIPMIHVETWTFENEILPPPKCTSVVARNIELQINRNILNHELINDDRVVPSYYTINWDIKMLLFDMKIEQEHAKDSSGMDLGHRFIHPISDLKEDIHLLKPTTFSVDKEKTIKWKDFVEEILGDILPVRLEVDLPGACLSQDIVHLMGMETMMYSLIDYPDEFHQIMSRITKDYIDFYKWLEKEGLLTLNNGSNFVRQGSFGYTRDLPGKDYDFQKYVTTHDMWGYMDSQETVSISPEMYGEFFFPYYAEVAKNFGLLSYGCCEPVDSIWDKYLSKLANLRKISISPWCNEEYMGEALRESNVIYHRKPSPNYIGVGKELDESAFSEHILKTLRCAEGCKLEFSFRDVYTLGGNIEKPRRAVEIVRELIERYWK